jgi:Kef-type K+ transport system membrane component KefB
MRPFLFDSDVARWFAALEARLSNRFLAAIQWLAFRAGRMAVSIPHSPGLDDTQINPAYTSCPGGITKLEELLLGVIVQLGVIIAAARFFGSIFRRMGQPQVCGEIAAGLVLGPSLFGSLFPSVSAYVFAPSVQPVFEVISQLGLVFLLFLIGLEFDFSHLKRHHKAAVSISLASIVVPFGLGLIVAALLYPYVGAGIGRLGFLLFVATAISITALPVLGRMLVEFNINRTAVGTITITAAAIGDAAGWIILATVSAIVRSELDPARILLMVMSAAAYTAFMLFVARPYLVRWTRRALEQGKGDLSLNSLAIVILLMFASAAVTNLIGLFSILGAFVMGTILFDQHAFREAVTRRSRDFVTVFFLPIFFTYTGLKTDIGTMQGGLLWGLCLLLLAASIAGKLAGATAAARWSGLSWRESLSVGTMMNTRGLMELIVVNVGYHLGVIPLSVFFMLVFMAVVTTFMTPPILSQLIRGTAMETDFSVSDFGKPAR